MERIVEDRGGEPRALGIGNLSGKPASPKHHEQTEETAH